jgi:regulatory protein
MSPRAPAKPLTAERAIAYALDLLSRQSYSRQQLATRLLRRGLPEAATEGVLKRLEELALVDDPGYAAAYLRSRRERRGRVALRADLLRRGVDEAVVEAALGDDTEVPLDDAQQLAAACELLRKHAWRFPPSAAAGGPEVERKGAARRRHRAMGFLARRGFSLSTASKAVVEAFGEDGLTP